MTTAPATAPPAPTANDTGVVPLLDRVFPPHLCDDAWADELLACSLASVRARESVNDHLRSNGWRP